MVTPSRIGTTKVRGDRAEAELHQLAAALRARSAVLVCWHPRRGGGAIDGRSVTILPPGESALRATSDSELAAIRALELAGQLVVHWPFRCMKPHEPRAPIVPEIEAAARAL